MGVINAATLATLGFLLVRKLVMMDRFFAARVCLITAFLCGLLLFAFSYLLADPPCFTPPPDAHYSVYACTEL